MIGPEFHFREKIPVAILGATGSVGQKYVQLLSHHPWFEIVALAASEKSAGRSYAEAAHWQMPVPLTESIGKMIVRKCVPDLECSLVFSGLDSSVAGEIESAFANKGYTVISNSRNHRMDPDVPIFIPEVNTSHLGLLETQIYSGGKIVTNPNCIVMGLAIALKPLADAFGIEALHVVTLQAISGAGFAGRRRMDIDDNVIPYISGEEQKIETELLKILGKCNNGTVKFADFKISAHSNRVPVSDGHTKCVSLKLKHKASPQDLIAAWNSYRGEPQELSLPSAPKIPIHYFEEEGFPQPKHHRDLEGGMAVSVGRLRTCPLFDYKFVTTSHNTIRGAAGGAILIAEHLVKKGYVYW